MFASSIRERLERAGLTVTDKGVKAARHEGKASLISGITKDLAKLKAADLLLIGIIVADLGFKKSQKVLPKAKEHSHA